jgi:hypothetical protein
MNTTIPGLMELYRSTLICAGGGTWECDKHKGSQEDADCAGDEAD